MRSIIRLANPVMFAFLLLGCTQSVEPKNPLQEKVNLTQSQTLASWHDGSTGGAYGIGKGWSLEILPPTYETFEEKLFIQEGQELMAIPAKFEWVKEDSEAFKTRQKTVTEIVTLPAIYESITAPEEVEPARTEYFLLEPVYNSDGTLKTRGAVKARNVPALIKNVTRRVVKTPARTVERILPNYPLLKRDGYVRVMKTRPITIKREGPDPFRVVTRKRFKHQERFIVRRPDGTGAHMFETYEELTAFLESLK